MDPISLSISRLFGGCCDLREFVVNVMAKNNQHGFDFIKVLRYYIDYCHEGMEDHLMVILKLNLGLLNQYEKLSL